MSDPKQVADDIYEGFFKEGGPAAVVFAATLALALLVGLFVPAAGLGIMAVGVFASIVVMEFAKDDNGAPQS